MGNSAVYTLLLISLVKLISCSRPYVIEPPRQTHNDNTPELADLTIDQLIRRVMDRHSNRPSSDSPELEAMLISGDSTQRLAEMDMMLTSSQFKNLYDNNPLQEKNFRHRRSKRKVYKSSKPWTDAVVPYLINPWDFSGNERAVIHLAMQEWEQHTCIKFRSSNSSDASKLVFQNGIGCNSQLGEIGGAQAVNLEAPGCRFKGLYLHEIGHALGLVHEHQLPNRDSYIDIIWSNVKPEWRQWFNKYKSSEFNSASIPYDLESVMHYGITAFSYDDKSQTVRAKDNSRTHLIGKVFKKELSFHDIKVINTMYKCNVQCPSNIRCGSGGFVDKFCDCYCPDGTNSCQVYPTTTTKAKITCQNEHNSDADCMKWASEDQCSLNPLWMVENCRKSCDKCDRKVEPTVPPKRCPNKEPDEDCDGYAKAGECSASPAWMFYNCKASCGWCDNSSGCRDLYPDSNQCREWKRLGQCERNPAWMRANCRQTCDVCSGKPSGCSNKADDDKCYADAAVGECTENAEYMLENCAKACGKCGSCYNEFPDDSACIDLAKAGECTLSPEWMGRYCKKACDACDSGLPIGVARACEDRDARCEGWARKKECEANPSWMIPNCQKSCRKCSCVNIHSDRQCKSWAARGECESNPSWMAQNCQNACRLCTNLPPPPDRCSNVYSNEQKCVQWAAEGECFTNPLFMIPNCRKACTKCDVVSQCGRWSTWSAWTGCSRTCGNGMQARTRMCQTGEGTQDEMKGCMTGIVCSSVGASTTVGPVMPPLPTVMSTLAITTTESPVTTTKSTCENEHLHDSECEAWARNGHCNSNPSFMHASCALSCGICARPSCVNTYDNTQCIEWAENEQCSINPSFMLANCAKACNQCGTTEIVPSTTTLSTPGQCVDTTKNCQIWADRNHCSINPGYMLKNCARACGVCNGEITTTAVAPPPPECENRHHSCRAWADSTRDYCHTSTYVRKHCKRACNMCEQQQLDVLNTVPEGKCEDHSRKCARWTLEGRCVTAMNHMERMCPLSCQLCRPDPCENADANCDRWAATQACHIFPQLMAEKCRLACGYCRPEAK